MSSPKRGTRSGGGTGSVFCGADAEHEFASPAARNKLRVVNLRLHLGEGGGGWMERAPWVYLVLLCVLWYLVATIEQVRSIFSVDSFDCLVVGLCLCLCLGECYVLAVETKAIILFDLFHHCVFRVTSFPVTSYQLPGQLLYVGVREFR